MRYSKIKTWVRHQLRWLPDCVKKSATNRNQSELYGRKYTGISYALREAIPLIELLKELKAQKFPVVTSQAKVHCQVFEDNSGALETAKVHKFRPRTKHINIKLHHFWDYVTQKEVSIHKIDTAVQPVDYLTKPLNKVLLQRHRLVIQGW